MTNIVEAGFIGENRGFTEGVCKASATGSEQLAEVTLSNSRCEFAGEGVNPGRHCGGDDGDDGGDDG